MSECHFDLSKPTCRVCLENSQGKEMSSIFDVDEDFSDLHIYEKIEQCADIEVLRHEEMPSLICGNCYGLLKESYKFRTICRNSNQYLLQYVAIDSESPKIQKLHDKNPLAITENISEGNESRLERRNGSNDIVIFETIKIEQDFQFPPPEEEFIDDNNDREEWLDINYPEEEDDISCGENIALEVKQEIQEPNNLKKPTKRKENSDAKRKNKRTKSSKTLEISSDGSPIISEKKPRARKRKEPQPHICEVCGNIYQRRYSLELHMRRHRDEKPFACEICSDAFHSNFQLIRHMRKHTGARPYKCSYCPRAFGDQSTLIKHERVHRNERPFKCETCGKCFSYTGVLNYHKLVHTGEKPYACEICGKCFPRAHNLRDHLKTLQHQSDPRSKILLQNIRRNNESETLKVQNFNL